MKKLIYLLAIIFAVSSTTLVTSCGGDDPTENTGTGGGGNGSENGGGSGNDPVVTLTPTQQKKKLEDTTISFLQEFDAANFEEVVGLAAYLGEEYSDYDYDAVEEWAETCFEGLFGFVRSWDEEDRYSGWTDHYTYNEYNMLFKMTAFKGSFVAKNGRWKRSDANYLSFTAKDEDGVDCVLKLTTSGKEKKVYVGAEEDWDWLGSDAGYDNYYYEIDIINNYINVPSVITITLERGGSKLAELVVNTDLSSMRGEEFDLSKDRYNVSATFSFNGYSLVTDRIKYAPEGDGTELSYTIKHNKKNLLNITFSSELDVENDGFYGADNNVIAVNLMDAVQFKGSCSDANRMLSLMDAADDCDDESDFKEYVRKMNNLIDFGLYYDKKNVKYASVELEAFVYNDYWGKEWYCTPVIVFEEDGTSYSFEEFFDEKGFRTLIRTLERMMEDYEYMVEDAM